jgi:hypothetical protein
MVLLPPVPWTTTLILRTKRLALPCSNNCRKRNKTCLGTLGECEYLNCFPSFRDFPLTFCIGVIMPEGMYPLCANLSTTPSFGTWLLENTTQGAHKKEFKEFKEFNKKVLASALVRRAERIDSLVWPSRLPF